MPKEKQEEIKIEWPTKYMWNKQIKSLHKDFYKQIEGPIFIPIIGTKTIFLIDYEEFEEIMYKVLEPLLELEKEIILGETETSLIDTHCIRFCKENNIELKRCIPNWNLNGKGAQYQNIQEMINGYDKETPPALFGIAFRCKTDKLIDLNYFWHFKENLDGAITYNSIAYPFQFTDCYIFNVK